MFKFKKYFFLLIFIFKYSRQASNDLYGTCPIPSDKSSMSDRVALRQILKSIGELSNNLDQTSITEIRKLIAQVTTSVLDIKLPEPKSTRINNIYSATIYETSNSICSVFGMQKNGARIPLHDHTKSYGFIKVLRGSVRIKSFSFLDSRRERELRESSDGFSDKYVRPVIYEGEQIATATDNSQVLLLTPSKSNIHEVVAIEDGTAFFDCLIPGYTHSTPCFYYKQLSNKLDGKVVSTKAGDVCWLKIVDMPRDYYTDILSYRQITTL